MGANLAVWPARESGLGLKSWLGETARLARLAAWPPAFPAREDLPRGNGQGVLVIPGFLTGDGTTGRLRTFLWRTGYHAEGWRCGRNFGPRSQVVERLKGRIAALADKTGGKVALAGVSLGGLFAREMAKMMPDHVQAVATLCAPVNLPVPTPLAPFVWALQRWFDPELVAGSSGAAVMPAQPTLAIYSQDDGIVEWRACLPPEQENVRVVQVEKASHTTIGSNPVAQGHVARFLADAFARQDALPQR